MSDLKDVTSSTFGLVIAYLLPGLVALYALSLAFESLSPLVAAFAQAESKTALFLLVMLGALAMGLQLTAFRWVVFENVLCRKTSLRPDLFAGLADEKKLAAFRVAVDEHYRYHQFWGGVAIVLPFLLITAAKRRDVELFSLDSLVLALVGLLVEAVTVAAAMNSWRRYIDRARKILEG